MSEQTGTVMDVEEGLKRLGGNKKLYCKLLKTFLTQPTYGELKAHIESADIEKAQASAHALKGMAANLSLKALYESVAELEAKLKQGSIDDGLMVAVKQINEATTNKINEYIVANQP